MREWRITLVRAKGQDLGRVEATAIKVAIEQFAITDPQQQRRFAEAFEP
jgi:hypothetical protein